MAADLANTGVTAGTFNNVTVNAQGQVTAGSNVAYLTSEVDGNVANEGSLTVGAGTATTSLINSNTSGSTPLTITAGSNITLSESGNNITIASTNPGGTVTSVNTGAGLTGGPITGSGTISIANGGVTNTMLANSAITVNTTGVGLSVSGSPVSLGGSVTVTSNGTSNNTANTLVARDASGNFSAGQVNANLNGQWLRIDDRTIAPSDISSGYARFGFTSWNNNNSSPYADFLHLRSYTDATGGNDNLVMFRKDAIGMRIYQQAWNSATPYATYKDVAFTDGSNISDAAVIKNQTTQQPSSNFNISGAGVVGTTMTAATYQFPAPTGDPSPVITARTVPAGQGSANEKTELILFHSNDPANGSGNDQITLRAPALSFQTYNNSGVGDINNSAGYNERMYINPDGNVGIGTTSPAAALHLQGDRYSLFGPNSSWGAYLRVGGNGNVDNNASVVATNGNLHLDAANGAYGMYLNYYKGTDGIYFGNGAAGATGRWTSAGRLGIGTTGPASALDVRGGLSGLTDYGILTIGDNSAQQNGLSFGYDGTNNWAWMYARTTGCCGRNININNSLYVQSSGNVGVGTNSPGFRLHVPSGYIGTDYINTTDNVVSSGVTYLMAKQGDNYHRSADANAVKTFLGLTSATTGSGSTNVIPKWTSASTLGNSLTSDDGTSVTTSGQFDVTGGTGTSYITAPIEVRTTATPRISFHWPGVVASQLGMGSDGQIRTFNNPGTAYEAFHASDIYANSWLRNDNVNTGLYNQATGRHFYSESGAYWATASGNGMVFRNGHAGTITGYTYWDGSAGNNNFGLLSPSGNWRFRADNSNTEAYGGFYFGTGYGSFIYDRDNTGYYLNPDGNSQTSSIYNNNWFRAQGQSGFYFQDYGGGWQMTDGTWIRAYNSKPILATGGLAGYGNASFGTPYGGNPRIYANYDNVGAGGIAVADDGGFYDFNDGWVESRGSTGLSIRSDNTSWDMIARMYNNAGAGPYDKRVATETNAWGLLGASGNAWYQAWAYSFNNPSERQLKKDIIPVTGSVGDLVMADLDKMNPYMYRYNIESDEWTEGREAKYRTGVHMGLILDETPDYIQSNTYTGVDVYAVASLGVAAGKYNREDIKQIKESIGLNDETMNIQDFGSMQLSGSEMFVAFGSDFAAKLGSVLPVITVTANQPNVTVSVTEKSSRGFKVVSSIPNVTFDYIAMARVKNALEEKKEPIAPEVMNRIRVSEQSKAMVKEYWEKQPEELKKYEEQKRKEAIAITEQRAREINPAYDPKPAIDPAFDAKKDAEERARIAAEAKKKFVPVEENAPAKSGTLADPNPSKENAPK